ncbi:PREDICTED: uncharacterized protein LOC109584926 [Amphimedon queenslandica]|uniref:Death domain-containing protein n=1 Tax=Amphimedon queenslandica TaxID=400682 RepID=A0AAN0JH92_AMPQE|nr:PREDICTED: uncharacterized protein LOC109584926 [Amphimedon queenslandica]|eukprot:XP_019856400.1 PREDICTED: uncharacterized protein LOC109584926 [Amphimedon queenslandica]
MAASPLSVMNGKPDLKTVCAIVRTSRWHMLGLTLKVDDKKLQDIASERSDIEEKRTQMFRAWLNGQPGASHNQLVEALRLKVIGEDRMAQEYEEKVKEEASKTRETTQTEAQVVQAASFVPAWSSSTALIAQKASEVPTLQALELQKKYRRLLELIQDLSQNANVGIVRNQLRAILLYHCIYQLHGYKEIIDGITSMDEVFAFLIENHFVGYLNYALLEEFSKSKVICGDRHKEAQDEVLEYEKHYRKFIEEPAFYQLIEVFDENPHLNPGTVVGLPIVIISLSQKWKTRNKKDLNEWISFLKDNKQLLQSIGYKCILITYAIFPVHLLKVMRFLSNEEHMKRLKNNGITIETPSYTMEIAERLREVEQAGEDSSDEIEISEKGERIQQDHLKDEAYSIVQNEITMRAKKHKKVHKIEKRCKKKLQSRRGLISAQTNGKFKHLFKDKDKALLKSNTQIAIRFRRRSERVLNRETTRSVVIEKTKQL